MYTQQVFLFMCSNWLKTQNYDFFPRRNYTKEKITRLKIIQLSFSRDYPYCSFLGLPSLLLCSQTSWWGFWVQPREWSVCLESEYFITISNTLDFSMYVCSNCSAHIWWNIILLLHTHSWECSSALWRWVSLFYRSL